MWLFFQDFFLCKCFQESLSWLNLKAVSYFRPLNLLSMLDIPARTKTFTPVVFDIHWILKMARLHSSADIRNVLLGGWVVRDVRFLTMKLGFEPHLGQFVKELISWSYRSRKAMPKLRKFVKCFKTTMLDKNLLESIHVIEKSERRKLLIQPTLLSCWFCFLKLSLEESNFKNKSISVKRDGVTSTSPVQKEPANHWTILHWVSPWTTIATNWIGIVNG